MNLFIIPTYLSGNKQIGISFTIALILIILCAYIYSFYDHIQELRYYNKMCAKYDKPTLKSNLYFNTTNILTIVIICSYLISFISLLIYDLLFK